MQVGSLALLYLQAVTCSALTCFNCPGIRHPRFCEHVQECSDNQICGVERITDKTGEIIYKSGCMTPNTCHSNTAEFNSSLACFQCCSSNLCNTHGCGEDTTQYDGRICYTCQGVLTPDECHTVSFCNQFEICYTEERIHFGEHFYHSGCKEKHVCVAQYISNPIIGRREESEKRSTSHLLCCDENLCNKNYQLIATPIPSFTASRYPVQTQPNVNPDHCHCLNGGTCQNVKGDHRCMCRHGYYGIHCQNKGTEIPCFKVFILEQKWLVKRESDVLVAGKSTVKMTVQDFTKHDKKSVTITEHNYTYILDDTVRIPSDGTGQHGALICANDTASMYGFYDTVYGGEGYLSLPAKYQSTQYVIPSYNIDNTHSRYYSSRSIVAISPLNTNTVVHILLKSDNGPITVNNANYTLDSSINMVLNPTDTFQFSHTHDLTGTLVTSSAPVFVISGSNCINTFTSKFPGRLSDCNPLMEMILPTNQLDSLFIVPDIAYYQWSTVRVLCINATSIIFRNSTNVINITLTPREYTDFQHRHISYIQASDDVIVTLYPHYEYLTYFDSFMMTIHGVNQYLAEYHFAVPSKSFNSSISIAVQSSQIGGFMLDNHRITIYMFSISHGSDDFSTGKASIKPGVHHIKHLNGVKFGLWVYGSKMHSAYGYPGGIQIKN
ncbi:uncharacterized protein LOC143048046 [Mytilus galloprovincialis]|uniref:uncharacterized protein LOC143048046 n=1 Tax=Mytilus galloprovincialis TaxID=29158 RepID=UPI003F7B7B70